MVADVNFHGKANKMTLGFSPTHLLYSAERKFSAQIATDYNKKANHYPSFLRLINLFFNQRVCLSAIRLGLTLCVMSKYERLGFFFLMLSVAF